MVGICRWKLAPSYVAKNDVIFFHTCLEGHLCIDLGNPTVKFYTKRVKANKTGFLLMYLKLKWAFDLTSRSHLRVEEVKNFGWTLQKIDIHLLYVIIRCICTGGTMGWFGPKTAINFCWKIRKTSQKLLMVSNGTCVSQQLEQVCLSYKNCMYCFS